MIRIGTRSSPLALAQTQWVAGLLEAATGETTELVHVTTHGDVSRASLASLGGVGVFATALRTGLLAGEYDLVVHSFKDLPAIEPDELTIAAIPTREDPRDALCARDGMTLAQLPAGARVGTGSPRRAAQLSRLRADLHIVDLRGNVGTRLERVTSGQLHAVVLAAAGLERLGLTDRISERFDSEQWPTAPAQGAVAVEARAGQDGLAQAIDVITARLEAFAERAVLAGLQAGCAAPVAASARWHDDQLDLHVRVFDETAAGDLDLRIDHAPATNAADAEAIGRSAAEQLLTRGAREIVERARGAERP